MEGDTLLEVPRSAMQEERSAVGFVGKRLALSFVHRIVSEQLAFEAGEVLEMGVCYLCWREGFCPDTCLQHATDESVTEVQRSSNRMLEEDRCVSRRIGHLLGSRIETDESGLVVVGDDDAGEGGHQGVQLTGLDENVVAYGEPEFIIAGLTEEQEVFSIAMHEEDFVLVCLGRFDKQVDREGSREATIDLRLGISSREIIEDKRRTGCDTCLVGDAGDLEVIILIKVVTGDRFIESQD